MVFIKRWLRQLKFLIMTVRQRLTSWMLTITNIQVEAISIQIIEITMFKGRSNAAKKALYRRVVDLLEANPGIPGNDITIIIHEPPLKTGESVVVIPL